MSLLVHEGDCRHVGVCCPDDIALSGLTGSMLVMDLPAGGLDYEESETNTGKLSWKLSLSIKATASAVTGVIYGSL